ncbi:HD domain-containing protein [Aliikangiella sp. IMCC44653]
MKPIPHQKIESYLAFMQEIEKLKGVLRATRPIDLKRYENSAEHSWQVALTALMFKDLADHEVNIDRVIKMLLIHDLGEIDTGDSIVYSSEAQDNKDLEEQGVKRILGLLGENKLNEFLPLWQEFEAGETADSQFARAIDRIPPLLHNLNDDYHSWRNHNIQLEQVLEVNSRIEKASKSLWQVLKTKIESVFNQGLVHPKN